ncbi:glycosyltransferase family 39 protein [Candidatus Woesearchaeota archaeon]|nr:glycosyltransferase family 39 protein [Candidatus Woesearchaeota archaeon]
MKKISAFGSIVQERPLLFIVVGSLLVRLLYLLLDWPLWWDSHVYIGMGKYIFSQGGSGIWEVYRPLLHPIMLGGLWKVGFNPFIMGKILDVLFSTISIYLVYLIGKKIFDEKIGLVGAFIFSIDAMFITITGLILADPLALFFGLLGVLFFLKEDCRWAGLGSGVCLAFSFLTRFPYGIWFGSMLIILALQKEGARSKIKKGLFLCLGFFIPVGAFLYFNYLRYGDPLLPLTTGSWIITTATWLYGSGIFFYFKEFFLANPVYLFFFPSVYFFFKERLWKENGEGVVFIVPLLTLLYFLYVPRKEVRYLLVALPFFALTAAYGLRFTLYWLKNKTKPIILSRAFVVICAILILLPVPTTLNIERVPIFTENIKVAITQYNVTGLVLSSSPAYVSFLDHPLATLDGMTFAPERYGMFQGRYAILFVNDCDLICSVTDGECNERRERLLGKIEKENKRIFRETYIFEDASLKCRYSMYLPMKVRK